MAHNQEIEKLISIEVGLALHGPDGSISKIVSIDKYKGLATIHTSQGDYQTAIITRGGTLAPPLLPNFRNYRVIPQNNGNN